MSRSGQEEPDLPPGAARDLVDLFGRLRSHSQLRVGQIADRAGYTPSHISEVLRGRKTPSPEAATRIVRALGGDENTVRRARRRAEDLIEWKRHQPRESHSRGPSGDLPAGFPVSRRLDYPDVLINIIVGDIFDQDTHLAVSFSDTFDISVADDLIIHSSSLQGQLLQRFYHGDERQLDAQLDAALASIAPAGAELRSDKKHGKLTRYPLGTVAVLGEPQRRVFAVAFGRMGNDLVVRAPIEDLWQCYTRLWEAVYRFGQRGALAIPLIGSGLARVDTLDRNNLLRLILLSFVAYSRRQVVCHELRVVIFPGDASRVAPTGLSAILDTL